MKGFHGLDARLSFQFPLSADEVRGEKNRNKDLLLASIPTEELAVVPRQRIIRTAIDHEDNIEARENKLEKKNP